MTGSGADADDVVQEAFVRLVERRDVPLPLSPVAWLWRVVTHLSIDAARSAKNAGRWATSLKAVPYIFFFLWSAYGAFETLHEDLGQ